MRAHSRKLVAAKRRSRHRRDCRVRFNTIEIEIAIGVEIDCDTDSDFDFNLDFELVYVGATTIQGASYDVQQKNLAF